MLIKNYKLYYAAYMISYMTYGIVLVSLGPLIPFLAAQNHILETQYSFLYTCRAFGMLIGSLLMNWIEQRQRKPTIHRLLVISSLWISITSIFFIHSSNKFYQGIWIFIGAIGYFILEISISICIIDLSDKNKVQFWLMLINGVYGIGGIISPILVCFFEVKSYYIISGMILLITPLYLLLPSPQLAKQQEQRKGNRSKTIDIQTQHALSLVIFIYIGSLVSKGSWSSTYAVMSHISTKQQATMFPSLFYFTFTLSSFIIPFIAIKSSEKLKYSIIGVVIFQIFTILLLKIGFQKFALLFNSCVIAMFMSTIYALIFSISSEFNMPLKEKQTTSIAIWGVVGEGILAPIFAKMMEVFTLDMYFYLNIVLYLFMWFAKKIVMDDLLVSLQRKSSQMSLIHQIQNIQQQKV